ncbi:hypothetical protein JDV02_003398 [Purpureocillium takamizusanense]|uniref:Zinc-ribbon domain-containing protein n=1 Tax=Purpureocillium takamizusanense TaxID=2060973 RepID=A0A9Q8QBI6_9HYPO|nr:uncharacterized protein JDV02_003398 [Purpureocillium takamizusanense]UNI17018.1 hypothetical protein JDV02_003398 [Purpureocillium takamizusanense]
MFGRRRRRPILGAAVLAGTATVAARHGARQQAYMTAEQQFQMQQEAELRRYAEENQRLRSQRAVDDAVNEALVKQQTGSGGQQAQQPTTTAPTGQDNVQSPPGGPPTYYATNDPYSSPAPPSPYLQPGPLPPRPRSTSAADSGSAFCTECGTKCGAQDNFCSRCGQSLSTRAYEQQEKQAM